LAASLLNGDGKRITPLLKDSVSTDFLQTHPQNPAQKLAAGRVRVAKKSAVSLAQLAA